MAVLGWGETSIGSLPVYKIHEVKKRASTSLASKKKKALFWIVYDALQFSALYLTWLALLHCRGGEDML